MSTVQNPTAGVAKTYPPQNFGRKFSGRKFVLIIGIFALVVFLGVEVMQQLCWAAYLNRVEPRENFSSMIFDLRKYEKRVKEFPVDLSSAQKSKWKWAPEAVVEDSGVTRRGKTTITKFQYRQYDYLYARIDENTAVIWAVPVWVKLVPEGWYTDMYTHHNESIQGFLDDWRKEKETWFVVLYQDKVRAWQGALPPLEGGTKSLASLLEPSNELLQQKKLIETKAERWIK